MLQVELEARPVTVYALRQTRPLLPLPAFGLEVECGGGFYVRTLVEDLARALGSRAHMIMLERTRQVQCSLEMFGSDEVFRCPWSIVVYTLLGGGNRRTRLSATHDALQPCLKVCSQGIRFIRGQLPQAWRVTCSPCFLGP